MTTKIRMQYLGPYADGILFADPRMIVQWCSDHPEYAARISAWCPTMGGKILADCYKKGIIGIDVSWTWPVMPVIRQCGNWQTWMTGTVRHGVSFHRSPIEPEVNLRWPRFDDDGIQIPRISRKVAHRVLWCDRNRGVIVTDPLYRQTFTDLEGALAFIEEKRRYHFRDAAKVVNAIP